MDSFSGGDGSRINRFPPVALPDYARREAGYSSVVVVCIEAKVLSPCRLASLPVKVIDVPDAVSIGEKDQGILVPDWFVKLVPVGWFGLNQAAGEKQRQY